MDVSSGLRYEEDDGRFRIAGRQRLWKGGQSVSVAAPIDTLPVFVRAGTIVPTLDPSVWCMSEEEEEEGKKEEGGREGGKRRRRRYGTMRHVLHLWAWLDEGLSSTSGPQWDGGAYTIHPYPASSLSSSIASSLLCTFSPPSASDAPFSNTFILQLALPLRMPLGKREGGREGGWSVRGVKRLSSDVGGKEGGHVVDIRQADGGDGGGWRHVVHVDEDGWDSGRKEGGEDLWAMDEEEQGVFWLRVTSSGMKRGTEGGSDGGREVVRVLLTLE
ncbi:alpha-glucosidase yihq-like [Nannochloropsis oceanica]